MEVVDDTACEDAYFISLVEEAEAKARLAGDSKRQKLSSSGAAQPPEGLYTAALRGSRSSLWQQQQQDMKLHHKTNARAAAAAGNSSSLSSSTGGGGGSGGGGGGGCFKCGMDGHWARDCTAVRRMDGGAEPEVAEKSCPCGSGTCLVLTSSTAKNPGRKFYRCPVKEENGGCNFFEWCDNQSSGFSTDRSVPNTQLNSFGPDLPCPCGAGSCVVLVARSGKNVGQQYYRCPANEGSSCGFFKWCNEQPSMAREPAFTSKFHGSQNNSTSQPSGERSDSSCFKCGQKGHWARDCPNQSSDSYSDIRGSSRGSSGSGTCFKCNKAGHWARDCPSQDLSSGTGCGKTSDSFRSPYTYKHK